MRSLRWVVCGLAFGALVQQASAADLGETFLRGSQTVFSMPGGARWDGFYFGGQVGANYGGADFSGATKSLVGESLRNSIWLDAGVDNFRVLSKYDTSGSSWGGFAGYNMQWDGAVVGVELNYNRTNLSLATSGSMGRVPPNFTDSVSIDAAARMRITDYGTARVRGGWTMGQFMPYGFVGLAVGRADVDRTATTNLYTNAGVNYFSDTININKMGDFAYGYTAGLGADICLMQNLFVRGEYEYVGFGAFNDIKAHIHTMRVGAGVKF